MKKYLKITHVWIFRLKLQETLANSRTSIKIVFLNLPPSFEKPLLMHYILIFSDYYINKLKMLLLFKPDQLSIFSKSH